MSFHRGDERDAAALRARVAELEAAFDALRTGAADAFVGRAGQVMHMAGAERPYATFFQAMGEGGVTLDGYGTILNANPRFLAMLGRTMEDLRGEPFLGCIHPADRERVTGLMRDRSRAAGESSLVTDRGLLPVRLSFEVADMGPLMLRCVVVTDLSERVASEAELRIAAIAFETQDGMMVTDADGVIVRVNSAFTRLTGYAPEELVGQRPSLLHSGRHSRAFYESMWESLTDRGYWQGEIWNRTKGGQVYAEWLAVSAVLAPDGSTTHYVGTYSEIARNREAEAEIHRLAYFDPLTHLPNRRLFYDRMGQALAGSARSGNHGALLFFDLDHFKGLNDLRGHDVGDHLLAATAGRLRSHLREVDTVARLGGDEFLVILEDLSPDAAAAAAQGQHVGEKLQAALAEPYDLHGHEYHGSTSLGIALFHGHDHNVDELLRHADHALYRAKGAGRNTLRFFDPLMQRAFRERSALEHDLRFALQRDELRLYYQPQYDGNRRMIGAEALLRWEHPRRGLVQPGEFISIAEDTGLIVPIGEWVLREACEQLREWSGSGALGDLRVSINVSARQLRNAHFAERVEHHIEDTGADPRRLTMELTESMVVPALGDALRMMETLKALGIGFSLDDFGTGNSSLAYLTRLPLDELKIDRSFVLNLPANRNDAIVVQTIITMATSLGLGVIAEGVETDAQWRFLERHDCSAFQGFLLSEPVPADALERLALAA